MKKEENDSSLSTEIKIVTMNQSSPEKSSEILRPCTEGP
jgi:hypothetical protein